MRITVTQNSTVVADVYVCHRDADNATRAAAAGDLEALAMVSKPWANRVQGRPVVKRRDGIIEFPSPSQHVRIDLRPALDDLVAACKEHREVVESLGGVV